MQEGSWLTDSCGVRLTCNHNRASELVAFDRQSLTRVRHYSYCT